MISVIIPNYNNKAYLEKCLDSVLTQTLAPKEVIVVDDGSSDGSRELLREYATRFESLIVIENEENMGVVRTRDRGIKAATQLYITTLDSDDYYYTPDKLEKEFTLLEKIKAETGEDVMPFSNTVFVDADGTFIKHSITDENLREGWIFNDLLVRKCAVPRDFIFLREHYFKAQGFDPAIPVYEDWDLKLRLSHLARFVYTHHNGVAYRQTTHGLSSISVLRHLRWKNYVFRKNVATLSKGSRRIKSAVVFRMKLLKELLGAMRNYVRLAFRP